MRSAQLDIAHEVDQLSFPARLGAAVLMSMSAAICIIGSLALAKAGHWAGWLFVFLVLEPFAVFLVLGAFYFLAPTSWLGNLFTHAMKRAMLVFVIIIVIIDVFTIVGLLLLFGSSLFGN